VQCKWLSPRAESRVLRHASPIEKHAAAFDARNSYPRWAISSRLIGRVRALVAGASTCLPISARAPPPRNPCCSSMAKMTELRGKAKACARLSKEAADPGVKARYRIVADEYRWVRFITTVASGYATLATKRALALLGRTPAAGSQPAMTGWHATISLLSVWLPCHRLQNPSIPTSMGSRLGLDPYPRHVPACKLFSNLTLHAACAGYGRLNTNRVGARKHCSSCAEFI